MTSQKTALIGVLLLLYVHHHYVFAASGGRIGGSSFSSSRSRSSSSFSSLRSRSSSSFSSSSSRSCTTQTVEIRPVFVFVIFAFIVLFWVLNSPDKTSIIKLQVGLLGTATSLQKNLNQIAESADTSTPKGFRYILQGATVSLLQNLDYCVSGYSSVDLQRGVEKTEKQFNKLSVEERGKFDVETLVNVNNIRKQSATRQTDNRVPNEYIVVTIIAATSDVQELPAVKSSAQLKEALEMLASIPKTKIMAAEVLWTPQQENDCLTEGELHKDYPLLHPL